MHMVWRRIDRWGGGGVWRGRRAAVVTCQRPVRVWRRPKLLASGIRAPFFFDIPQLAKYWGIPPTILVQLCFSAIPEYPILVRCHRIKYPYPYPTPKALFGYEKGMSFPPKLGYIIGIWGRIVLELIISTQNFVAIQPIYKHFQIDTWCPVKCLLLGRVIFPPRNFTEFVLIYTEFLH